MQWGRSNREYAQQAYLQEEQKQLQKLSIWTTLFSSGSPLGYVFYASIIRYNTTKFYDYMDISKNRGKTPKMDAL